ncbi:hypothetical protein KYC5002_12430 [Archangium violaceum]|uniref:hypothetical protein n=1 Tax=Archangium violaceum TaxID=83451 RepID=UPI002B2B5BEA|nr:hypothetical protein KYC5002_12430 [Archangium gephyra]
MTDSVRLLVHEPTRTLVRCRDGHVQLIREGREVASEYGSATISDALGLAEDGTLFLGEQGFFDLQAPTLRRRNWDGLASYGSRTLHPKGQVALVLTRPPVDDPSTYGPVRETHARVQPNSFQLVLASTTGQLETLAEGSAVAERGGRAFKYLARPIFAPDGQH